MDVPFISLSRDPMAVASRRSATGSCERNGYQVTVNFYHNHSILSTFYLITVKHFINRKREEAHSLQFVDRDTEAQVLTQGERQQCLHFTMPGGGAASSLLSLVRGAVRTMSPKDDP